VVQDQVHQLGEVLLRRRLAHEKPDVLEGVCSPRNQNQDTNQNGTNGVKVPHDTASNNRHSQTKRIDDNVIAVVDEEHVNRRITAKDEAVYAQRTLGENWGR
jgi:hypothetical protein